MFADEKRLIEACIKGEDKAYRELYRRHGDRVYQLAYRYFNNPDDAADITQETFLRVFRSIGNYRGEAKLSTWIARIAYNIGLSHIKKKNIPLVEETVLDHVESDGDYPRMPSPHVDVEQKIISGLVQDEIERLPVYYKTAMTLYHLDGMSYDEIVDIMKVSEGTVKSYIFRGRKMLKERLLARYSREDLWN